MYSKFIPNIKAFYGTLLAYIYPYFSPFKTAVDKLRSENYDEIIPSCTSEIEQTPPSSYQQLAILLRGTMFSLRNQLDDALTDLNTLLDTQDLDKKVSLILNEI